MELEEARKKIDLIDSGIIKMLSERMELALRAGKLKDQIFDPEREKKVIANVISRSHGVLRAGFSEKLFRDIIAESKHLQERGLTLMGFQGEHGAFGEVASNQFNRDMIPIPCREFVDVFNGVANNQIDLGIVPVENSLEGAVTQVNDLLIESDLKIVGEVRIPISHCLLTLPDTDYREIKVVYSHPQALAQCRGFLQRNNLEPRPYYDTAGAAKMLSRDMPKASAAIANRLCAELYNLQVIKENIEDHASNTTRFVVLSNKSNPDGGNKCSLIFATEHRAGKLFNILKLFADAEINLTRIESRPLRSEPGNYAFLLDFQGNDRDEKIINLLEMVKQKTILYKFLGSYEEAKL
jgi:prephenate dehydratase/chorismate mutase